MPRQRLAVWSEHGAARGLTPPAVGLRVDG
jgi:hypothetical protein